MPARKGCGNDKGSRNVANCYRERLIMENRIKSVTIIFNTPVEVQYEYEPEPAKKSRDPLGQKDWCACKACRETRDNERQRCLKAIQHIMDGDRDSTWSPERENGFNTGLMRAEGTIRELDNE